MINFESQHFQKLTFQEKQIDQLLLSAQHDLKIAEESDVPDVVFTSIPALAAAIALVFSLFMSDNALLTC
jgi:hypothetical protein